MYGGAGRDFKDEDEDKPASASKFLDSLRTDAYVIAEDLGPEILGSKDNIPSVIEAVRNYMCLLTEQESKEL